MAGDFEKKLSKLRKEGRIKNTDLARHLQQLGEMRRAKETAEMQEAKARDRAFKEADAEAQRKLLAVQLEQERVKREARLLEIQEKEKEDRRKKGQQGERAESRALPKDHREPRVQTPQGESHRARLHR